MSISMMAWMANNMPAGREPKMRKWAKIRLIEFLRPDSHWPYPYTLEQAFEVFRWMVKTGKDYRQQGRWGSSGPIELLSKSSGLGLSSVEPITSIDDLRERFQFAMFSGHGGEATRRWREDFNIHPDATRRLYFNHYDLLGGAPGFPCHADIERALKRFFDLGASAELAVSPNPCHPEARTCISTSIMVSPDRFRFFLRYGYDGSIWELRLAATAPGEPFVHGLARAVKYFDLITGTGAEKDGSENLVPMLNAAMPPDDHTWDYAWIHGKDRPVLVHGERFGDFLVHSAIRRHPGGATVSFVRTGETVGWDPNYRWEDLKASVSVIAAETSGLKDERALSIARQRLSECGLVA